MKEKTKHFILKAIEDEKKGKITPNERFNRIIDSFEQTLMPRLSPTIAVNGKLSEEDKAIVEKIIKDARPEIEAKAKELLVNEIREGLSKPHKINELKKMIKEKRKPKLLRRKGCIYLGFENPTGEFSDILISQT